MFILLHCIVGFFYLVIVIRRRILIRIYVFLLINMFLLKKNILRKKKNFLILVFSYREVGRKKNCSTRIDNSCRSKHINLNLEQKVYG